MATSNIKIATALIIVGLLVGTGATVAIWEIFLAPAEPPAASTPPSPPGNGIAPSTIPSSFDEVYGLPKNEVIRRIAPPFVEARMDFYRKDRPARAKTLPQGPEAMLIFWREGKPRIWGMNVARAYQGEQLIETLLDPPDLGGDLQLIRTDITGDFSIKPDVDQDQLRTALEKVIGDAAGVPTTLNFRQVQRQVIVFRGKWQWTDPTHQEIQMYGAMLDTDPQNRRVGFSLAQRFPKIIGTWINRVVIFEASGVPQRVKWFENYTGDGSPESLKQARDPDLVCQHIQEQTGLSWTEENRTIRQLFVERAK
jgi:hypothetical protein